MSHSHLDAIDAQLWPGVAEVPVARFGAWRARRAEAQFAQACDAAGLVLEGADADLRVAHDALFDRLAHGGWVGFAESYLAGEWTTPDSAHLVCVLKRLLGAGYAPKTPAVPESPATGGELPTELVKLYAGDRVSHQGGIFSTGVPTTVRESVPAYERSGAKEHFVDVTHLSEPTAVDREDLRSAQERSAAWLADATRVGAGSHVLVFPATGLQAAVQAAERRAVVDILTADPARAEAVREHLVLAGVSDNVACQDIEHLVPSPQEWRGRYDAIISIEALESLGSRERGRYVQAIDRLLDASGRAVIQTTVATERMTGSGCDALQALKAYVWPGLGLLTVAEVNKLVERSTGLRIVAQTHTGPHYRESLEHERSFFVGHLREAAAAGFDPVYRRLWTYQFALREALFALGMADSVQFTLVHRNRGGRR